ncbi:uncharacterized protein LOC111028723 [Myzus persicae]|uniref:uncharacterized protein LOC111028723 n=1 Tax=Myzus persicae TaxID=13164 RepID=UPI000B937259|nr:uncharacterized protein LOC111028723 [Myzus persicae]XP_022163163.1 uncharacterized protein LOC111028723 [Myzus persicae]
MDTQFSDNVSSANDQCHQRCCVSSTSICHIDCNSTNSNDYVFDMNDHTTLISNCTLKKKKYKCRCSLLEETGSKSNTCYSQPWITFIHILCTAILVLFAVYLESNVLIFEKNTNKKEMDDIVWRLIPIEQHGTTPTISSTTDLPPKDKCEPLYVLVYAHCCVWFLFLVLDHVARHMHHKTLRSRGHLRAYARLTRLAVIPFQLVSLWTVLLAIFIAVYAQQDAADMQPYCDANMLMSPKNGIAVLLVIEFVCVTISSLLYANSIRKFSQEKPPPDVCGWEENNYCDRWTPQELQNNDVTTSQQLNPGEISNSEQQDSRCLLDLLEYYSYANRELAAQLACKSGRLRQLEVEKTPQQPSQS